MDLDWFWRGWLYTTARLDQSVDSVATRPDGTTHVTITNRGTMVMPDELRLTFADGGTTTARLPVQMWNLGQSFDYRVKQAGRVIRAEVDPRGVMPDIDRANNAWPRR
jgi:hypothetical protein